MSNYIETTYYDPQNTRLNEVIEYNEFGVKNGIFIKYFNCEQDVVKIKTHYINDEICGDYITFYEDGSINILGNCKNKIISGQQRSYENGILKYILPCKIILD
jgi:antitoxin component YwqK of YwqJK toxin-antitoxin module